MVRPFLSPHQTYAQVLQSTPNPDPVRPPSPEKGNLQRARETSNSKTVKPPNNTPKPPKKIRSKPQTKEPTPTTGPTEEPTRNFSTFRWNLPLLASRGYTPYWGYQETSSNRNAVLDGLEHQFGLHRGPRSARILLFDSGMTVILAEEGVFITDTFDDERIALISRDPWKAEQIMVGVGFEAGREGPWRAKGQTYDAGAPNQEQDWFRFEEGWESPGSCHSDSDDDPKHWR
ncbi:hypothetical protein BJ508DRAFT_329639 [Ascobolus immersus RN42]|uniref:Uncharacterized protein n=1 Tax=Ascobolus immersus RN42 TaxID=1160509 RepID=A0A3N4HVX1_ASCIM|nr:hypothetical protein BJ508DRAFT_329639 [Ascobolus immersus RN42]